VTPRGPGTPDEPVAVITGAARGIGRATAWRLARDGYRIAAIDRDGEQLDRADLPPSTVRINHDIAELRESLDSIVDPALDVRVLVNNVGVRDGRSFLDLPVERAAATIRTNLLGSWAMTRAVSRRLVDAGRPGSIVFVLSLHTNRVRLYPDYSVSKAGLSMLVQELAGELGPRRIRVNAVSPGYVDTYADTVSDRERVELAGLVPLGRIGRPDDVADAVAFLCDDERASYLTGADIRIDGGLDQFNWLHHRHRAADPATDR
jgi:NAD(P)-dependent dehydrogenase (short-subunit alcohol dehydrogenase family)